MTGDVVRELGQIDRVAGTRPIAAVRARHGQEPIDETAQPVRLLQHALDDGAVRRGVARLAQGDLADAANRRQRRPQLVGHVGREPPHLGERGIEPAQCLVEHRRQAAQLVVRIVDGQPLAEPGRGDGARPLGHVRDRRERATRQVVAAESRRGDAQRQAEQQHERQLSHLPAHQRLGPTDLNDDRIARDDGLPAQNPERRGLAGDGDDAAVGAVEQPFALRHREPPGNGRPVDQRTAGAPHLQPGTLLAPRIPLEPGERPVGPPLGHARCPPEVAAKPRVERPRYVARHDQQHRRRVDRKHDHHDRDVPRGEPDAKRAR